MKTSFQLLHLIKYQCKIEVIHNSSLLRGCFVCKTKLLWLIVIFILYLTSLIKTKVNTGYHDLTKACNRIHLFFLLWFKTLIVRILFYLDENCSLWNLPLKIYYTCQYRHCKANSWRAEIFQVNPVKFWLLFLSIQGNLEIKAGIVLYLSLYLCFH